MRIVEDQTIRRVLIESAIRMTLHISKLSHTCDLTSAHHLRHYDDWINFHIPLLSPLPGLV